MCRALSLQQKRDFVPKAPKEISLQRVCDLLGLNRSTLYYKKIDRPTLDEVILMNKIQDLWLDKSFLGYRRITFALQAEGYAINHKRVLRLMNSMGIQAIYPKPNLSKLGKKEYKYAYLLNEIDINEPNIAWGVDITYLKINGGFMYLFAIIDIYSRYIVSWKLSNTLDTSFCIEALEDALYKAYPSIINCDQGCQFTSEAWCNFLTESEIRISMDAKGRCFDNIFIERFWRTLKYEEIYLKSYDNAAELKQEVRTYIDYYNNERPHQSLGYETPSKVFHKSENLYKFIGPITENQVGENNSIEYDITV